MRELIVPHERFCGRFERTYLGRWGDLSDDGRRRPTVGVAVHAATASNATWRTVEAIRTPSRASFE